MVLLSMLMSLAMAESTCQIKMNIEGMTWSGGCPGRVSSALMSVEGVVNATANFEKKTADVKAKDEICKTDGQNKLVDALKAAGYGGKVVSVKKDS